MKKDFFIVFFRSIPLVLLVSGFSCKSPFQPVTNIGKDVVTVVDSNVTDLNKGFKVLDSIDLAVQNPRSLVGVGSDTGVGKLQSGDHAGLFSAGSFGDDNAVAYAELQMYSSSLSGLRTSCDSSVDSIYLVLYYDTVNNDITLKNSNTIKVYSCARKYFPDVRNELTTNDSSKPSAVITISRAVPDSFFISLGANMVDQFNRAIAGTSGIIRYIAKIDTAFGKRKVVKGSDTIVGPDTVFHSMSDTVFHIDSVTGLESIMKTDTAIINYSVLHFDSSTGNSSRLSISDTVFQSDTVIGLTSSVTSDTGIISFSAIRFCKFDTTFMFDSSSMLDSSKKFIGAVRVYAEGGGMVNFSKKPIFQIKYKTKCLDSVWQTYSGQYYTYFDVCAAETKNIPADSLVASWQADRFVELPINLQPLWDSVKNGDKDFKIVQDASCLLNTATSLFEGADKHDTLQTIVYGLLDHQITGSKVNSSGTRDSLIALIAAGRLNTQTVHVGPTKLSLPMTMFLQSLVDRGKKPTAYLYLFVKPPSTTSYFRRVVFNKTATIRFSALFSNLY